MINNDEITIRESTAEKSFKQAWAELYQAQIMLGLDKQAVARWLTSQMAAVLFKYLAS